MPSVREVQKLKEEVEELVQDIAKTKGALEQLRSQCGGDVETLESLLIEKTKKAQKLQKVYDERFAAYQKLRIEASSKDA